MIKAVTILKRKHGMSVEEFQNYWRCRHAEVIRRLPGIRRYVQSHPLPDSYSQGDPVCDGVAELWADNSQTFREIAASDAYTAVQADEKHFIDQSSTVLILTEEHVIKDGQVEADGIKTIEFIRHAPAMTIEEFQRYWHDQHGPVVARLPMLQRYVQSHTRLGGYAKGRKPIYDGIESSWYDCMDSLQQAMATPAYAESRANELNFIASGDRHTIVTSEYDVYN